MPFLLYQQVAVTTAAVLNHNAFNIPDRAQSVFLQAGSQDVHYTMDDETDPTSSSGMIFQTGDPPEEFLIEDFKRIRFTKSSGGNSHLNAHFYVSRNV